MSGTMGQMQPAPGKRKRKWFRLVLAVFAVLACIKLAGIAANHFSATASETLAQAKARKDATMGFAHATAAAGVVEAFYKKNKEYPANLTTAEFNVALPTPVQSIRLNSATGVLQVVMMGPGSSASRTFFYEPHVDSSGVFAWRCNPGEIAPARLPDECLRMAGPAK